MLCFHEKGRTRKEGIMSRSGDIAIALPLVLAAIAAGYALYSETVSSDAPRATRAVPVAQQELSSMQSATVDEPLRDANPFDASEIFEFPAGTSEADAREAVAGFLIERATRRGAAGARTSGHKS
jgi:hypothetical protein